MLARIIPVDGPDGRPDNSLPPEFGGRPDNSLPPLPGAPDNTLPKPPPGVWPPPSVSHPIVPVPPTGSVPPGTIWPSPGQPDNALPGVPPTPGNGLPSGKFWVIAGIPGIGWRYVCVDPSLRPGNALPGSQPGVDNSLPGVPARPDNTLPATPLPKR
jgi:hypothetical protein